MGGSNDDDDVRAGGSEARAHGSDTAAGSDAACVAVGGPEQELATFFFGSKVFPLAWIILLIRFQAALQVFLTWSSVSSSFQALSTDFWRVGTLG